MNKTKGAIANTVGKYSRQVIFVCKFPGCKQVRRTEMSIIGHIIEDHGGEK